MPKTIRLPYKGPIQGFAKNYIRKNMWRLRGHVLYEDILSDSYEIYMECFDRYGGIVDTPQWFMALFKRSFINYFHAVSTYATFLDSMGSIDVLMEEDNDLRLTLGVDNNIGELILKITQAPEDVRKVIEFLLDDSPSHKAFESVWKEQGKKKVDGNEYICRALGYNPRKVDLISMVYNYFIDDIGGS